MMNFEGVSSGESRLRSGMNSHEGIIEEDFPKDGLREIDAELN
jgi:hypothetical protein